MSSIEADFDSWMDSLAARWCRTNAHAFRPIGDLMSSRRLWAICSIDFNELCKAFGLKDLSLTDDFSFKAAETAVSEQYHRLGWNNMSEEMRNSATKFDLVHSVTFDPLNR